MIRGRPVSYKDGGTVAGRGVMSFDPRYALERFCAMTREELLEATGFEPGTVSPFGIRTPLRVLVDDGVLSQSEVSLGSGVRGVAIKIQTADLLRGLGDSI